MLDAPVSGGPRGAATGRLALSGRRRGGDLRALPAAARRHRRPGALHRPDRRRHGRQARAQLRGLCHTTRALRGLHAGRQGRRRGSRAVGSGAPGCRRTAAHLRWPDRPVSPGSLRSAGLCVAPRPQGRSPRSRTRPRARGTHADGGAGAPRGSARPSSAAGANAIRAWPCFSKRSARASASRSIRCACNGRWRATVAQKGDGTRDPRHLALSSTPLSRYSPRHHDRQTPPHLEFRRSRPRPRGDHLARARGGAHSRATRTSAAVSTPTRAGVRTRRACRRALRTPPSQAVLRPGRSRAFRCRSRTFTGSRAGRPSRAPRSDCRPNGRARARSSPRCAASSAW